MTLSASARDPEPQSEPWEEKHKIETSKIQILNVCIVTLPLKNHLFPSILPPSAKGTDLTKLQVRTSSLSEAHATLNQALFLTTKS